MAALFGVLFFILFISSVGSCAATLWLPDGVAGSALTVGIYLGAAAVVAAFVGLVAVLVGLVRDSWKEGGGA